MADDDRPSDERVSRLTDEQIDFAIRMVDALPESEHLISMLRARAATYKAEISDLQDEIERLRSSLTVALAWMGTDTLREFAADPDGAAIIKEARRG